jgi:predicted RND superfamily exporter protein
VKAFSRYRWIVLAVVAGLCAFGSRYIGVALQPNNDLKLWFEESDSSLIAYNSFQSDFGNDRVLILIYRNDSGIVSVPVLNKFERLESALLAVEGVKKVSSIRNAKDFRRVSKGTATTIVFSSWFDEDITVSEGKRDSILASSMMTGKFINGSGNTAQMVIHLEDFEKIHKQMGIIIPAVQEACETVLGKEHVHLSGTDMLTHGINELSRRDFIRFTGISYLIMFLAIGMIYQRPIFIALAFLSALTALWLTLSLYGFLGRGINMFTVMTPPIVITMTIINVMHILNRFTLNSPLHDKAGRREVALATMADVVKPCFYASITTVIGFLSLVTSKTAILKEFGWLTATGCLMSFAAAFVWANVVLSYADVRNRESFVGRMIGDLNLRLAGNVIRFRRTFLLISIALTVCALIGFLFIKVDIYPMGYFPRDYSVRVDHDFTEKNWGKYYPIDMVLTLAPGVKPDHTAVVKSLIQFKEKLDANPEIGASFCYVDVMDRLAQVSYRKDLKSLMNQPLLIQSFGNRFNTLVENENGNLVNAERDKIRINVTGSLLGVKALESNLTEIHRYGSIIFKDVGQLTTEGYPSLFIKIMDYAFASMKSSLLWSFVFVFCAMLFLLRSFKLSCIALVPNIFPIIILLGVLGFAGINLDLATCTVAAIALGIAVDDTIHILFHFTRQRRTSPDSSTALLKTFKLVGSVVTLTSIVLITGFSVLMLAGLKTVFYFGMLSAISVAAALFGDMIILPLILTAGKRG